MSPQFKSRAMALATLIIFMVAVWVLRNSLSGLQWNDVVSHLRRLSALQLAMATLMVACSYVALSFHDWLAVRFVGGALRWREIAPVSFTAGAIGLNLGLTSITGGAVRLQSYTRLGLSAAQVGGIIAMCAITFGLGVNVLLNSSLLLQPELAARVLGITPETARMLGALGFVGLCGWFWLTAGRSHKPFTLAGHRFTPPRASFTLRQLLAGAADLSCSAIALYWLLPDLGSIGFAAFIGSYVLAMAAGIFSSVPGGLGVFESVLLLTLPDVPKAEVIGAALAFRLLYFLLPFALALLWLLLRMLRPLPRRLPVPQAP